MKEKLRVLCDSIVKVCAPTRIILYGCKTEVTSNDVREVNLLIVVKERAKELERELYRNLECDFAFNLLLYNEDDYTSLISDPTSYASCITRKGTVLYG